MNRKFELLLLKNTLAVAIPAVAVFAVLMAFLVKYPIFDKLDCKIIEDSSDGEITLEERLDRLFENETYNVSIEPEQLYYSGFDYYVDNVKKGSYYYTIFGEKLYLYLLGRTDGAACIDRVKIKAKIIKDKASTDHILNMLTQSNGISYFADTEFYSEYIVSELDYPGRFIGMVYLFYAIPIVICGVILFYTVMVWVNPKLHSQARQLRAYGNIKTIIRHIDKQLQEGCIYKKGNIYITSDYMIISYLARTDVIKLDMVRYVSKNVVETSLFWGNDRPKYRITLSSPEILFYEVDFENEKLCDTVLEHINILSE